ncbi:MAG: PEPxxWA-CTERM sorting domain-containing protein [Pseudomonadota bacterium]
MSNFKKILVGAVFAASTAMVGASAHAAVFVSTSGGPDPGPVGAQTVLLDFESPAPAGVLSGSYSIEIGGQAGQYAAPWLDRTHFIVVPAEGTPAPPSQTASIDIGNLVGTRISSFSFYWGSNDKYNEVRLYDKYNTLIHTTVGSGDGSQAFPLTNQRYNFILTGNDKNLGRIELYSNGKAFEADDFAFSSGVPEPATWAMMIMGFGAVGSMARSARRRQALALV